jgi:endonuclease YncB( thermonuclease family)
MRSFLVPITVLLAALLACQPAAAWTLRGQVVGVVGGDTIKVRDEKNRQYTVRLAGLDAPEKFQTYGQRAEDSLRELVFQRGVSVEIARQGGPGKVLLADGKDMNLEQLKRGFAWYDKSRAQDLPAQDREAYAAAEADARMQRVGLWRDAKPIPPWEYRQGRRR